MTRILIALFLFAGTTCVAQSSGTEWDDYFMPGVGYKVYVPKNDTALGMYQGVVTEFVIYARAKGAETWRSGPARVKTFANLSIMKSSEETAKDIFFANVGLNLSFEGMIKRKYFIPVFGIEIGGLYQRNFSTLHYSPTAGIQLASTQRILFTAYGGYQYTNKRFDEYSGFIFGSTLNVLLWHN